MKHCFWKNKMKRIALILIFLSVTGGLYAQLDESQKSIKIDAQETNKGVDIKSDKPLLSTSFDSPSLSKLNSGLSINNSGNFNLPNTKDKIDRSNAAGLRKPETTNNAPKWFTKDKEVKEEYLGDQYLGDFKSNGKFVNLVYRDHQYVDGDRVRIYLDDDVVRGDVYLGGSFQGFTIDLQKGFNKIDIEALNQGTSGPNTAAFQLYDDQGNLLTSNQWNLTTGAKATMIIVKD